MPTTNFDDVNVNVNGYVACDNPDVIEVNGPRRYTFNVNHVNGHGASDNQTRRSQSRQRQRANDNPDSDGVNVNVNGYVASDNPDVIEVNPVSGSVPTTTRTSTLSTVTSIGT